LSQVKITNGRLAAYALPGIPGAALGLPLVVYLPTFYASSVGLDLAAVGVIFMLARFWDVFTDPTLGVLSDKIQSRWGRRRHWLVASVPFLMLSAWMIFVPPEGAGQLYLGFWLFVLYIGFTLLTLSHMAWGAELSDDYHDRSKIMGIREAAIVFSMAVVLALPALIDALGWGTFTDGIASMGWFIIIMAPITVGAAVYFVPENPSISVPSITWRDMIHTLRTNKPLRQILAIDLLQSFAPGITGSLYIYFVSQYMQLPKFGTLLLLVYFFAGLFAMPMWIALTRRFGKHKTLAFALFYGALALPLILFMPKGVVWVMGLCNALYGIAYGAMAFLQRAIMADVVDIERAEGRQPRTGVYFALLTLTGKIALALAAGITFIVLDLAGFEQAIDATNDPQALQTLALLYTLLPAACMTVAGFIVWRFPIDEHRQRELIAQMHMRSTSVPRPADMPLPFGPHLPGTPAYKASVAWKDHKVVDKVDAAE